MKRMQLIAAALCLVMLLTVGAGVVAAKQTENPRQAGESSIYFYDVKATDTHGSGKLMINLDKHTFEFNGQGFDPSTQILLRAKAAGSADYVVSGTGKATPSGNLHIAGTWEADTVPADVAGAVSLTGYNGIYALSVRNYGAFVAQIACYYSTDGGVTWIESSHTDGIAKGNVAIAELDDLGVPVGALVKIHVIVVAGNDRTGSEVWQYDPVGYPSVWDGHCRQYAKYEISGTTLTSKLSDGGPVVMCCTYC